MDNSKTQLHEDANDISLKNKLQTSHSDKVEQGATDGDKQSAGEPIDTKNLNPSKESEAGMPIANEVIEEQDEHDEEERKNMDQ